MHPLHFEYVSENRHHQSCSKLFQLMDDLEPVGRDELLRDAYISLNVFSKDGESESKDSPLRYREFKKRFRTLTQMLPEESPFIYGMVCYILGSVSGRSTKGIFAVIERQLAAADIIPDTMDNVHSLRAEEHQLRVAYREFCELVLPGMLGRDEDLDFGDEMLPDGADDVGTDSDEEVEPSVNEEPPVNKLFPMEIEQRPYDAIVTTFLDQVSAAFEKSVEVGSHSFAVRVADKGVMLSVGEYCGPSEGTPDCPLVLRLNIRRLNLSDQRQVKRLGLRLTADNGFAGRLEFSVFPNELALLASWTEAWIRGQESRDPNPPPIPIRLAGENQHFEFCGDPSEPQSFVEPVAEAARISFSNFGAEWLEVKYLWSGAARQAHNSWTSRNQTEEE